MIKVVAVLIKLIARMLGYPKTSLTMVINMLEVGGKQSPNFPIDYTTDCAKFQ